MSKIDQLEKRIKDLERKMCCKTQFFDTVGDLPAEGNTGVIYVTDDGNIYVWNGADYVSNGLGDDYYSNSYVERLKALGSDVQYSTYPGGSITTLSLLDNTLLLHSIYINKTSTITGVGWVQAVQGNYTADEYNGIGLYSYDKINEKIILIASTANDGDIWKAASGVYATKDFITPITINSGIYYIGLLYNNSAQVAVPTVQIPASQTSISILYNTISLTTAKINGTVVTQNTLPTEVLNTNITNTSGIQAILYLY